MKTTTIRTAALFSLALCAAGTQVFAFAVAPTAPAATWKIAGDIQGIPVNMTCTFTQTDTKLAGTCAGAPDAVVRTATGELTGAKMTWHFDSAYEGSPITISMAGTLSADGAKMTGTMFVAPMEADGTFAAALVPAESAAPVPAAAAPAAAATMTPNSAATASTTGVWKIEADVMGNPIQMLCRLTETAKTLSGTCAGAQDNYAEHKVAGKVKDASVEWHFQSAYGGNPITVSFTGNLAPDGLKVSGDIDVEPVQAGGAFTAVRQPADAN